MYSAPAQQKNKVTIKDVRQKMGLTQAEFAELFRTDRSELSRIESGRVPEWLLKAIYLNHLLEKAGYSFKDLILALPDPQDPQQ